jgi:hypothetical protein
MTPFQQLHANLTNNMTTVKNIFAIIFGCLIASGVHAQSPGQPVTPMQLFPSSILNIYSPNDKGWVVTSAARNGISFGKKGTENNETYGAQVIFFEKPPVNNDDDGFINFVKKRIATMNPTPRFQELKSSYQYSESRGYPCVDAQISFDDTAAATPTGKEQLKLQVISLYCRHPTQHDVGFFAAYSHRGTTIDDRLDLPARNFIDGISVQKK